MTAMTTSRWKRYGHDRLYVTLPDGDQRVGWVDLMTGHETLELVEFATEFAQAVRDWRTGHGDATPALPTSPSAGGDTKPAWPAPVVAPVEMVAPCAVPEMPASQDAQAALTAEAVGPDAWHDLSGNRPGELVIKRAAELRAQAPLANFVALVLGEHTEARAFAVGGRGEAKVGKKLDGLPDDWHSIHSVPVGERGSDIDHVVVGPGGVFTLNTKHHPKGRVTVYENALLVNGRKQPYLRNSRFEADRAAKFLTVACGFPVSVTPVLVFVGADITFNSRPVDVRIAYRENLIRWLKKLPACLDDATVLAIYEMARRDVTWHKHLSG